MWSNLQYVPQHDSSLFKKMSAAWAVVSILSPFHRIFKSWEISKKMIGSLNLGPFSQHFIFFVTFKCDQSAGVLHNTGPERFARYKHSRLQVQFVSYEENGVLQMLTLNLNATGVNNSESQFWKFFHKCFSSSVLVKRSHNHNASFSS